MLLHALLAACVQAEVAGHMPQRCTAHRLELHLLFFGAAPVVGQESMQSCVVLAEVEALLVLPAGAAVYSR